MEEFQTAEQGGEALGGGVVRGPRPREVQKREAPHTSLAYSSIQLVTDWVKLPLSRPRIRFREVKDSATVGVRQPPHQDLPFFPRFYHELHFRAQAASLCRLS